MPAREAQTRHVTMFPPLSALTSGGSRLDERTAASLAEDQDL